LGGEVIHGHLAGHREPQIQRILLGPLVVHSNSLPDTWVSNLESAPPEPSIRGYLFARLREDGPFLASKSRSFRKNR
ncbi:hypothetical protein, partial [Adlercreutzia sp.]|uniref:hypothetical protein n=1 Tax=Adlercreutzia sp. TaxID=1872387 RepID=UPI003A94D2B9